jgi:hydrogenase maturation protease
MYNTPMKLLVLGIGQSLRGDDAAGLAAVRVWQQSYPQSAQKVLVELCELPGLALLDRLESFRAAILVDAVHAGATPGRLYCLGPDELSAFTSDAQSAHGWGVAETLALGRSLYPWLAKCRLSLIGIAGAQFDLGAGLSPAVQAALMEAAASIEKEIQSLLEACAKKTLPGSAACSPG